MRLLTGKKNKRNQINVFIHGKDYDCAPPPPTHQQEAVHHTEDLRQMVEDSSAEKLNSPKIQVVN